MKQIRLSLLLSMSMLAQNVTVDTATQKQTILGWMFTPTFIDALHTTAYYDAWWAASAPSVTTTLFHTNMIQEPVYPLSMYSDQDYFAQFRAGTLVPATDFATNYGECPVSGGTTQDSFLDFFWVNGGKHVYDALVTAGVTPKLQLRFILDSNSGGSPNCTGSATTLPAWFTATAYATGWIRILDHFTATYGYTMNSSNIHIATINEPENSGYKAAFWTNSHLGSYAAALRTALNANGYSNVVIDCCEWNLGSNVASRQTAVNTAAGAGVIGQITTHLYDATIDSTLLSNIQSTAVSLSQPWMQSEWDLGGASSLYLSLKYGATGYEKFGSGSCNPSRGFGLTTLGASCVSGFTAAYLPILDSESDAGLLAPWFNKVSPGAIRVETSDSNGSYVSTAFLNLSGKYIVNVLVTATGTTATVNVSGLPAGTYDWFYSRSNADILTSGGTLTCGGGSACSAAIPSTVSAPGAVLTFEQTASAVSGTQTGGASVISGKAKLQ